MAGVQTVLDWDLANRLASVSVTPPAGTTSTETFVYAGADLIAEYEGGVLRRRYVPGPGVDEPVVWYEGPGLTDRR